MAVRIPVEQADDQWLPAISLRITTMRYACEHAPGAPPAPRTIDTHVLNLRQKVEADARAPRHILAVHGIGYCLVLDPSTET